MEKATEKDYDEIVGVWEASVRASHDFLTEDDIAAFRSLIRQKYLAAMDHVRVIRNVSGRIAGFSGISGKKLEILFIHPTAQGCGLGKRLVQDALEEHGVDALDVNEQNPQATAFYKHIGFTVESRSVTDSEGKPYPILHLRYRK